MFFHQRVATSFCFFHTKRYGNIPLPVILYQSLFITPDGSTKTKTQQYKMKNIHKYKRKNKKTIKSKYDEL